MRGVRACVWRAVVVRRLGEVQGCRGSVPTAGVDADCRQVGTAAVRQQGVLRKVSYTLSRSISLNTAGHRRIITLLALLRWVGVVWVSDTKNVVGDVPVESCENAIFLLVYHQSLVNSHKYFYIPM